MSHADVAGMGLPIGAYPCTAFAPSTSARHGRVVAGVPLQVLPQAVCGQAAVETVLMRHAVPELGLAFCYRVGFRAHRGIVIP